jgi:membrane protease YdiL (CAAX protease family)
VKTPSFKLFSASSPWEPALLFALFFLPGYLSPAFNGVEGDFFNSPPLLILYLLTVLPQTALVFYLILRETALDPGIFGLKRPQKRDLVLILPALGGLFLFLIPAEILMVLIPLSEVEVFWDTVSWSFFNLPFWPLVLLTCLGTGYLEEIFFRSYLCTRLEIAGRPRAQILVLVSLLFASGHFYQGLGGFFMTFVLGLYFGGLFFRYRSLHLNAFTHGLYNFTVLFLSYLLNPLSLLK